MLDYVYSHGVTLFALPERPVDEDTYYDLYRSAPGTAGELFDDEEE